MQSQTINNNLSMNNTNNKIINPKVDFENKLEFYNQLNSLSYQQIFNLYMKEKLFPTTSNIEMFSLDKYSLDNNRLSIMNPSIY